MRSWLGKQLVAYFILTGLGLIYKFGVVDKNINYFCIDCESKKSVYLLILFNYELYSSQDVEISNYYNYRKKLMGDCQHNWFDYTFNLNKKLYSNEFRNKFYERMFYSSRFDFKTIDALRKIQNEELKIKVMKSLENQKNLLWIVAKHILLLSVDQKSVDDYLIKNIEYFDQTLNKKNAVIKINNFLKENKDPKGNYLIISKATNLSLFLSVPFRCLLDEMMIR